jgi:putative ABC transport system permease protein
MFVAWRDLRFARGRFTLIGSVVLLITLLVGFLGGLTQGLAEANISAVTPFHADRIVLADPREGVRLNFVDSRLTAASAARWSAAPGITTVEPLGVAMSKVTAAGGNEATVELFGVRPGFSRISPGQSLPTKRGTIVLSERPREALHVGVGGTVSVFGHAYTVAAVDGDAQFSHMGVIWMNLDDWRATVTQLTAKDAPYATALAVQGTSNFAAVDAAAATTSSSLLMSLLTIEVFKSEIGSLGMMLGLLLGISALVIGAFFTVWTIQRSGDIAVLKALGASTPSLVLDALGQALVVLLVGVGLGIGITTAIGLSLPAAVPFVVSPLTTIVPAVAMIGLGLVGAGFALRSVVKTDPLTALNGQNS